METRSMSDRYREIYRHACNGNEQAFDFLNVWNKFCHITDDLLDHPGTDDANRLLKILAVANLLYSSDFYATNPDGLYEVVQLVTNSYADSIAWEHDPVSWRRKWADTLRFAGNEMVLAVAGMCGGWDLRQNVSLQLREDSWKSHHVRANPV